MLFGEAVKLLPFHHYRLSEVRRSGNKVIRTQTLTDQVLDRWESYADLLLLACIAEKDHTTANQHWNAAMRMWDGKRFVDAAARPDVQVGPRVDCTFQVLTTGLLDRLMAMQDQSGGWITDDDGTGSNDWRACRFWG